jgi:hypothetical protein
VRVSNRFPSARWDPTHVKSARGIAKTADWVNWIVTGNGLPGDAMFTSLDCAGWAVPGGWAPGGCVGACGARGATWRSALVAGRGHTGGVIAYSDA